MSLSHVLVLSLVSSKMMVNFDSSYRFKQTMYIPLPFIFIFESNKLLIIIVKKFNLDVKKIFDNVTLTILLKIWNFSYFANQLVSNNYFVPFLIFPIQNCNHVHVLWIIPSVHNPFFFSLVVENVTRVINHLTSKINIAKKKWKSQEIRRL